ncbi:Lysine-specific demethylase 6A [Hypsibius exemplaris]|uniref:Lysine-specific demethylase 6A n=1 Tax=Hypsibius exemplaris TaxID=2072580 RepID=A0A1W0XD32_HYPEX|nr:Lysine-specific demethylase 6A [Hypsibius exemplaris]
MDSKEGIKEDPIKSIPGLSLADQQRIQDFDSRHYDYLDMSVPTLALISKALAHYNALLVQEPEKAKQPGASLLNPQIFCRLGHLYLLVLEWEKALACYQTFYIKSSLSRKDPYFYYGLGLVYYQLECYLGAAFAFQHALYLDPGFARSNEILFRLGLIFKYLEIYDVAHRFFRRTMTDPSPFTETKEMINFHIGHIYELQGRYETAKKYYEQVIQSPTCDNQLRADVLRQMGWMFHTVEDFGERSMREGQAIKCLTKSLEHDPNNGQTWYFMGRCYAAMMRVHDAFAAYRSSIDKSEANADTWCSIGTLYQQQNQPMDALQAYVCAVQLDKTHSPAWFDLGMLYEGLKQFPDALHCYQNGIKHGKTAATPSIIQRAELLENSIKGSFAAFDSVPKTLPHLEEALALPIAAELTAGHRPPQTVKKTSLLPEPSDNIALSNQQMQVLNMLKQHESQLDPAQQVLLATLQAQFMVQQQEQQLQNNTKTSASNNTVSPATIQALKDKPFPLLPFASSTRLPLSERLEAMDELIRKSASEVLAECSSLEYGKLSSDHLKLNLLNETGLPPTPPAAPMPHLPKSALHPLAPSVFVENKKEALSKDMEDYLLRQPCAILKNLSNVLRLDLSLFSTKTLVETAPDHQIEVRTQKKQRSEDNFDSSNSERIWKCESVRNWSTVSKYGMYQAQEFQKALQEDSENKSISDSDSNNSGPSKKAKKSSMIRFGTNVDLSDTNIWRIQLAELDKLPPLVKVKAAKNMLSHLDHTILGMNSVQLYMKIPGCRTPGHQENLNFCSVNINIGPGDCEWFCVAHEYWGVIQQLCEKNDVHFLHGSWWPNLNDLRNANVPVYRFVQKPGDLVWVNSGTVHWVQALGWCNNIAWNVGPFTAEQYYLGTERYEWNKLQNFKSIVPMVHLTWAVAVNVLFEKKDEQMWKLVRLTLRRSMRYCQVLLEHLKAMGKTAKYQARDKNENAHYCKDCDLEVFNILFIIKEKEKDSSEYVVRCYDCARKIDKDLKTILILHQYRVKELMEIYDRCVLIDSSSS